jgi:hypothetical protein
VNEGREEHERRAGDNGTDKKHVDYSAIKRKEIGYCGYIAAKCKSKNENEIKSVFFKSTVHFFEKQLDITEIVKMRHELDIMNKILFSYKKEYKEAIKKKVTIAEIMLIFENDEAILKEEKKRKLGDKDAKLKRCNTELDNHKQYEETLLKMENSIRKLKPFDNNED